MKRKRIKKFTKNYFICPSCGKKQTSILQWQTNLVCYEYDFHDGWERKCEVGEEIECWICPECETWLQVPRKMEKNIQ